MSVAGKGVQKRQSVGALMEPNIEERRADRSSLESLGLCLECRRALVAARRTFSCSFELLRRCGALISP